MPREKYRDLKKIADEGNHCKVHDLPHQPVYVGGLVKDAAKEHDAEAERYHSCDHTHSKNTVRGVIEPGIYC
jgi:hypothetical protein